MIFPEDLVEVSFSNDVAAAEAVAVTQPQIALSDDSVLISTAHVEVPKDGIFVSKDTIALAGGYILISFDCI